MSPSSVILLSPVKKSSHLNQERNMHRSITIYEQKQFNKYAFDFFTGVSVIMDYGILFGSSSLNLKCLKDG